MFEEEGGAKKLQDIFHGKEAINEVHSNKDRGDIIRMEPIIQT